MNTARPILAFDFGSRAATAALAFDGVLAASVEAEREARDADLLPLLEECLAAAGATATDLGAIVALAGPGSFTGLRVACATALGLAAALRIPATGVSTLEASALSAPPASGRVLAVVDALRGEWFVQLFDRGEELEASALDEPRLARAAAAEPGASGLVVGADAERYLAEASREGVAWTAFRPAEAVARAASRGRWAWDDALLRRPLYLRAPATRAPA
ncbi:MAG TPA: tRNA (adenosine(37)-N6)-threonylcarbamoyltransferase complex dimerization subunit type 1 TsaB [Thermoanaerobaculia bacterium]|nr:tRNA (adenosine(37)-N6)-threonylcarbamoyltransferase complex dimerization subunit type 1 TsaB [Thermoanaerobaculia bacterium]